MNTQKIASIFVILFISANSLFAQEKNETLKVSGVCGMCKTKIEKAAKEAGATYAVWSIDKKELTVKYNTSSTNTAKIQDAVVKAGYDTPGKKATDEAYNNLHECCKYDRTASVKDCCSDMKCAKGDDCCGADEKCAKDCCKDGAKMECCKDGKCTKEGHTGKDCCKKA